MLGSPFIRWQVKAKGSHMFTKSQAHNLVPVRRGFFTPRSRTRLKEKQRFSQHNVAAEQIDNRMDGRSSQRTCSRLSSALRSDECSDPNQLGS